jgi:hypothetical protein
MSMGLKIFSFVAGPAFMVFGAVGFIKMEPSASLAASIGWHAVALIFIGAGAYCVVSAMICRIVLDRDSYTIISPFGRQTIFRDEIRGRRELAGQPGRPSWLILEMRDPKRKRVRIEQDFRSDPVLQAWIDSIPDLTKAS